MIAGALATLLASGAYFAADSIKTNANIYRNANRMDDEGVFWLTNPEVERMLQHDIRSLWETGKRDFIPEGLEGFFEENNSAREAYFDALAAQCMLETDASPWRHGARSIGTLITASYNTIGRMARMQTSGCAYTSRKSFWRGLRRRKKLKKESSTLCAER